MPASNSSRARSLFAAVSSAGAAPRACGSRPGASCRNGGKPGGAMAAGSHVGVKLGKHNDEDEARTIEVDAVALRGAEDRSKYEDEAALCGVVAPSGTGERDRVERRAIASARGHQRPRQEERSKSRSALLPNPFLPYSCRCVSAPLSQVVSMWPLTPTGFAPAGFSHRHPPVDKSSKHSSRQGAEQGVPGGQPKP